MKLNVNLPILDFDGKPVEETADGVTRQISASHVAIRALAHVEADDSGELKFRRYRTSQAIFDARRRSDGMVELSVEELADLKKLVGKLFGPLIVGRIYEWIEAPADAPRAAE